MAQQAAGSGSEPQATPPAAAKQPFAPDGSDIDASNRSLESPRTSPSAGSSQRAEEQHHSGSVLADDFWHSRTTADEAVGGGPAHHGDLGRWPGRASFTGGQSAQPLAQKSMQHVKMGEGPGSYMMRQILDGWDKDDFNKVMPIECDGIHSPPSEDNQILFQQDPLSFHMLAANPLASEHSWGDASDDTDDETTLQTLIKSLQRLRLLVCPACTLYVLFRNLLFIGVLCASLFSVKQLVDVATRIEDPLLDPILVFLCMLDAMIAIGSLLNFPLLSNPARQDLEKYIEKLLTGHRQKTKLVKGWKRSARRRFREHMCIWLVCLTARFLAERDMFPQSYWWTVPDQGSFHNSSVRFSVFFFCSALLARSMTCLDHMGCAMSMIVDAYCFRCMQSGHSYVQLLHPWNTLQALLRRTTGTFAICIMAQIATISAGLVVAVLSPMQTETRDMRTLWALAIVAPLSISFGMVFTKAAEVTEKCRRVPSLVNSMILTQGTETRFYLTYHISQSNAGFFVGEVAINGTLVLKAGHVACLALFAVVSTLFGQV